MSWRVPGGTLAACMMVRDRKERTMIHTYMVHYGEIALKGKNRPEFEHQLMQNIRAQHEVENVKRFRGRLTVIAGVPIDLSNVFGIAWWAEAEPVDSELSTITDAVLRHVEKRLPKTVTFAIRATRADKLLGLTSQEIEVELGAAVQREFDLAVDLDAPDLTVYVEILRGRSYVYSGRQEGLRGLPVGVSGKLMGLFSGGIDSAVAAYLMAKRGACLELLHFHAYGQPQRAYGGKIGELASELTRFVPRLRLHVLPYDRFQLATADLGRHQKQELVVFRRFMIRVADDLARQTGSMGLFTGDNLGQVASQTLENLAAVQQVTNLPIFRPLIAYDKQEIIDLGGELGLAELANTPYKDCCSIIAQHPATRANLDHVRQIEERIGIAALVADIMQDLTTLEFTQNQPDGELVEAAA